MKSHPNNSEKLIFKRKKISRHFKLAKSSSYERWDGKGYPDGLKGEEIPLSSRIVAIADTYDAMTSTRSYRKAFRP